MNRTSLTKLLKWLIGPTVFLILKLRVLPLSLSDEALGVAASAAWMSAWWILESAPIAVTALLPIVLFPITAGISVSQTTEAYGHPYIFLFLGGFVLALAIEKWNLHKRIALKIILTVGLKSHHILLGFMLATAFLSMWISNTASAVMLLPVGIALVTHLPGDSKDREKMNFIKSLMLSIAYGASIGGMSTLIGTPPNLVMAGVIKEHLGLEITFIDWFLFAFPLTVVLLLTGWLLLSQVFFKTHKDYFKQGQEDLQFAYKELGRMGLEEKRVLWIFVGMAFFWLTRTFLWTQWIPQMDDTFIAIAGAVLLFLVPDAQNKKLVNWDDTARLPWGIMILFGGGLALANAFEVSGLSKVLGSKIAILNQFPPLVLIMGIVVAVNFLTEITSNLATTAMLLPVLTAVISPHQIPLLFPLMGATLAASCAFMLPVATPPNAVVFGSGYLNVKEMVRVGFWMNILSTLCITVALYALIPLIWP